MELRFANGHRIVTEVLVGADGAWSRVRPQLTDARPDYSGVTFIETTLADGPGEYRSGSAWVPRLPKTAVAVGPTGSDVTTDGGRTWTRFDTGSFDAVDCARTGACWASGAQGAAARLVVTR